MRELTDVERSVLAAVSEGAEWSPDYYRNWREGTAPEDDLTIGADIIQMMVYNPRRLVDLLDDVREFWVTPRGIQITRAKITGKLDLEAADFDKPLSITESEIPEGIVLSGARLRELTLDDSRFPFLHGDNLRVDGNLHAMRLPYTDYIILRAVRIGGRLALNGSQLNPDGKALSEASGRVLNCDAATIGRDVFLRGAFSAKGEVRFRGATISGQMSCEHGAFENEGVALDCNAITVGADIFLHGSFSAGGEVSFVRATIGGGLVIPGSKPIEGNLDLRQAKVGVFWDDPNAWPTAEHKIFLDGFVYDRIDGHAPTDCKTRLAWLNRQPQERLTSNFAPQPWTQLAKVLKEAGHDDDARTILMKRDDHLVRSRQPKTWEEWYKAPLSGTGLFLYRWIIGSLAGYGYRTNRAVWIGLGVILLGIFIFAWADNVRLMRPTEARILMSTEYRDKGEVPPDYECLNPIVYSLDLFLPIVTLNQDRYWAPRTLNEQSVTPKKTPSRSSCNVWWFGWLQSDNPNPNWIQSHLLKIWYWLQMILGWVLSTIAIAGFSGLLKRGE